MSSVLLFGGSSLLDKVSVRENFLRIPEISSVVREAQIELEQAQIHTLDLISFARATEEDFLNNALWRDLVVQLFQIGFYNRLQKILIKPKFLIGRFGGISAIDVCLGRKTIAELIASFAEDLKLQQQEVSAEEFLVGRKLELSQLYVSNGQGYEKNPDIQSAQTLLDSINDDHLIHQVIVLGSRDVSIDEIVGYNIMDSLALDPLLQWILPLLKTA